MDELKTKQQVIDKLKQAEKVLVTVSKNPSVDALSAALGLTLLLDAQGKYATAIFSGETPPALAFLEPEKTFDDTTDSLRDFIIALNKEKADHLRYKVVDDAVKIFITPYKTTITEDDLEFSQGDYNVELVVAVGVDSQEDLDAALDNHGQILHDAAIITVSAGDATSTLGGIDWHDTHASGLSEMIAGLVDALKKDKKDALLTAPIATALLTGIVAETDRFSNEKTSSRAMTVAATLMAAGADQQLIATELQQAEHIQDAPVAPPTIVGDETQPVAVSVPVKDAGGLSIQHDDLTSTPPRKKKKASKKETLADLDKRVRGKSQEEIITEEAKRAAETPAHGPVAIADAPEEPPVAAITDVHTDKKVNSSAFKDTPLMGGVFNASIAQAENDARSVADSSQNSTILSHAYLTPEEKPLDTVQQPVGDIVASVEEGDIPQSQGDTPVFTQEKRVIEPLTPEPVVQPITPEPVLPEVQQGPPVSAYGIEAPAAPEITLPMPPPLPDFSQLGVGGAALPLPVTEPPKILGDILDSPADIATPASPVTDQIISAYTDGGGVQPASQSATVPVVATEAPQQPVQPSAAYAADPGQFKIPTQE